MTLKEAVNRTRLNYRKFGKATGISPAALSRLLNYGEYPVRADFAGIRTTLQTILAQHGVEPSAVDWPSPGLRPGYGSGTKRAWALGNDTAKQSPSGTEEIDKMQFDRSVQQLFGLRANPFLNDVESDADIYRFKGYDLVSQAICDAIEQRGFLAVSAPSGSGKTTIWDGVEAEYGMRDDMAICKPLVKSKDKLSPEHLAKALIYGLLGDDAKIPREAEDRGRQLSNALRAIRTGAVDRKAVLYIDDAHFCTASVLRQLKTFYEEKIGRYRLLAIILVGLPALKTKLQEFPEVGNRIRLVEVPPVPVKEYLQFKLSRAGSSLDKIFDATGIEAFLDRFREPKRGPLGRPLVINASCIRAMCQLRDNGAAAGERITREIIDQLPGVVPARRAA